MILASQSADLTVRNLKRVDDLWASNQAQLMADSAFGAAKQYIFESCADVGCNYSGETEIEADVIYGDYEITGLSAENTDEGDGYYYVPIPGRGDAAGRYEYDEAYSCDPNAPGVPDDECNWNKIYFGDQVSIPLYVSGNDSFDGDELYIRVRTPLCDDPSEGGPDCSNGRKVISCKDDPPSTTTELNNCDLADDKVILFWQIRGEREDGTDYVESREGINPMSGLRNNNESDAEIYITSINYSLSNDYSGDDLYNENYIVINMNDLVNPDTDHGNENTILEILTDGADPMLYPTLTLAYVETIRNNDGAIPYLEYQIVSDIQISNDRSFISARGFVKSGGDSYFWLEDGWLSQYTSSIINFAFQN